tara:strand:- start:4061 stop:4555 length:495 start_codon:yes stop_codon:yes gene_type:complete
MAMYPYNPEVDKPIFDDRGNKLSSIPTTRKKLIYNEDGDKLSKSTLNIPIKSGFGDPELSKKINRVGRPKGSRSKTKSTLEDAIQRFENYQLDAAELIVAIMMGDEDKAGGEIKMSDKVSAAKYVIEAPAKMKKSTSTEKEEPTVDKSKEKEEPVKLISLTIPG